jgi:AcrR family transcriptional regulator
MTARKSSRRQKQAAATRQDILVAARRLFADQGYVATSMAAIAEEADTAVQTIYDSIGPKRAIILALVGMIEDEAGVGEAVTRLRESRDPRELIGLQVGLARRLMDRSADVFVAMMSAAPTEPDVAEAWQHARSRHGMGASMVARSLASLGALRQEMPVERAGAILAVLTWGITWLQFTREHGWSLDDCERWMNETLAAQLLVEPA